MNWNKEQIRTTIVAFVVGVGGLVIWWWLQQPNGTPTLIEIEPSSSMEAVLNTIVIVDVQGEVRNPGIVELQNGARVIDAIEAAGGLLPRVTPGINLARIVLDGEQINIGKTNEVQDGKINLNTASVSQLEDIPGVGPVLASRIIEYRNSQGSFRTFEDVDNVSGVGPALLEQLRTHAVL